MIEELLKAFLFIFIAEMGDKTQILVMAFATQFKVRKVIFGTFLGSFLNHGLAVLLGTYISNYIPINNIQIIAGFAFIGFSLWTLRDDDNEEENEKQRFKLGPVLTVTLAFFIGELGDKTQLTAITLATESVWPFVTLCGTVLGMVFTGLISIVIGKKISDKISEFAIKIIASIVFMFFGITKLYYTLPKEYLSFQNSFLFVGIIIIMVFIIVRPTIIKRRQFKVNEKSKDI